MVSDDSDHSYDSGKEFAPDTTHNAKPDTLQRIWEFEFVPLGFFGRLTVRLLSRQDMQALYIWQHGIVLLCGNQIARVLMLDNKLFLEVRAYRLTKKFKKSFILSKHKLKHRNKQREPLTLHTRQKQGQNTGHSKYSLLRSIVDVIETLLNSWYCKLNYQTFIPCTSHCLILAPDEIPHLFILPECRVSMVENRGAVSCPNRIARPSNSYCPYPEDEHHLPSSFSLGAQVRLSSLAPDIAFSDLDLNFIIPFEDLSLTQVLGKGSYGEVFKGILQGREVAVKKMNLEGSNNTSAQTYQDFQAEAWMMSLLRHPNLVQLEGICLNPPMLVLEYVPEKDLTSMLRSDNFISSHTRHQLDGFAGQVAWDIACGMTYMHSLSPPIIHRDLKCPNILITKDYRAKIADFGTASFIPETLRFTPVDNPIYKAPETFYYFSYRDEYNVAPDVYSYAFILWELLCGTTTGHQFPFEDALARNTTDLIIQIRHGLRPTLPKTNENNAILNVLTELIPQCWHAVPTQRPSFAGILKQLQSLWGTFDLQKDTIASGLIDEGLNGNPMKGRLMQEQATVLREPSNDGIEDINNNNNTNTSREGSREDSVGQLLTRPFHRENSIDGDMPLGGVAVNPAAPSAQQHQVVTIAQHLPKEGKLFSLSDTLQLRSADSSLQCLLLLKNGDEHNRSKWTVWGGDHNGAIHVWSVEKHVLMRQWDAHNGTRVNALLFVEATQQVWSAGDDTHICIWNPQSIFQPTNTPSFLRRILPTGAGGVGFGETAPSAPRPVDILAGYGHVRCLAHSYSNPGVVFSGGEDGSVRMWDALTREQQRKVDVGYPVLCLLSVRNQLWVGTSNGVRLLSITKTGQFKLHETLSAHSKAVKDMIAVPRYDREHTFSGAMPEPSMDVWTASDDNTVCVWRFKSSAERHREAEDDARRREASSTVRRIRVSTVRHVATLRGHGGRVLCLLQVNPNQVWSAGSFDNLIYIWDVRTYEYIGELGEGRFKDIVRALCKIDDGTVWCGSLDPQHAVTIWQHQNQDPLLRTTTPPPSPFSPGTVPRKHSIAGAVLPHTSITSVATSIMRERSASLGFVKPLPSSPITNPRHQNPTTQLEYHNNNNKQH
eukprot:TRINITY_DN10271_c0_g1_i1.p1 TRINITY_DN10271_c0_g1~~TRINITY_DN10271_c0_g1_i1.p1  ORF type:complete len:1110 (-),score=151.11 TRINITY_DN10271_c0_g1_i1:16-3345(-)